jgi:2-polyprenyl-3-methyl-5-hydroxy-6-metoxy-1,4-benzoquinol methylase
MTMSASFSGGRTLAALRAALLETDYLQRSAAARYMRQCFSVPEAIPQAVRGDCEDPRLAVLLDLFAYGAQVKTKAIRRAIPNAAFDELERFGVLERHAGGWRSRVTISGHQDIFVFGDLTRHGNSRDRVDGYTQPADLARRVSIPATGARTLDLGTGSGIHALRARRDGNHAVGVDINRHALKLARMSALLSDIDGVDWREGSWYEPLGKERFDRILSNAPYVISPDSEFTYRDGDESADPLVSIAAGLTAHLDPGGCGQLLCCWGQRPGEEWCRGPLRWLSSARSCDVLLLMIEQVEPLHYAMDWNRPPMRALTPAKFDRVIARWLEHYQREGLQYINFGVLNVRRRRAGAPPKQGRVALKALNAQPGRHSGEQLLRGLEASAMLAEKQTDRELLQLAPAIPEGQRVDQRLRRESSRYRLARARLSQSDGLCVEVEVPAEVLEVIYRLDGSRTLAQALALSPTGKAGRFAGEVLAAARALMLAGLLATADQ